ncbi:MAG: SMP-30/gluconolactonase/LRE family protein [Chloroflexota bacterium]|nr:SMP-30/gluconolactonase/LRE family protein [Chloroflexota bacterium]
MPMHRSDDAPVLDVGEPQLLVDEPCETGEGPLWHEDERALYWLDIPTGRLFRYDPVSERNELAYQHDAEVGGLTIQQDGSLLLFCSRGKILHWNDGKTATVIEEIPAERENRFNDVIADAEGRVYCGTLAYDGGPARLYRLDPDGSVQLLFDDIGLSNGMGFTADGRTMYHTDTNFRVIYRLDYDRTSGAVTNRVPLLRTPEDNGAPDGMSVDAGGTIWSARYGGSAVFRYSPEGDTIGIVTMPVTSVTSITFGGPEYRTAFVTTATGGKARGEDIGELAGSLFGLDLRVQGKPPFRSRIQAP